MTSLSKQLASLRTGTSDLLSVEKQHVSLLFDTQEAKTIDRETAFKIGCTGIDHLRKLDPIFNEHNEFFEETAINFQRMLLSKEDNEKLNQRIEVFLLKLAPYVQHFACQQVLEWLVYKYQIYVYNAEAMILTFLPFHETNFYGKMLSIIKFNFEISKEYGFLGGFAKQKSPVPFNILIKSALSSNHSLITMISRHIDRATELVGDTFLETKSQVLFTFYTKLILSVLESCSTMDDGLLAKIIPFVASGLKSKIVTLRNASFMIICQLAVVVRLAPNIVSSLLKILLMKLRESTLINSISTLAVICQQQDVAEFSTKAIIKVLRNDDSLNFFTSLRALSQSTDILRVLNPLWKTLLKIAAEYPEESKMATKALIQTSEAEFLTKEQASLFLTLTIEAVRDGFEIPDKLRKNVKAICHRFANEWQAFHDSWNQTNGLVMQKFVADCKLQDLVVIALPETVKQKRARRNSIRKSISEDVEKKPAAKRAEEMAKESEFSKRVVFAGDPMKKALEWIKKADWTNVHWALDEMASRKSYFKNKIQEDVEDFVLAIIKTFVSTESGILAGKIKSVFAFIDLDQEFVLDLLQNYDTVDPSSKKAKMTREVKTVTKAFAGESSEGYKKRQTLVMEVLKISDNLVVSSKLFTYMFDILKEPSDSEELKHLAILHLIRMIEESGAKYKVSPADLQMDSVVELMRNTLSHHILRDALRLLTAAVKLDPSTVTSHVMSVFTFMGSGLLRKDNELTLSIIENTLESLFIAILADTPKSKKIPIEQRLVEVTRIFSASACDIPAHRRGRMAKAIARAIGAKYGWIVSAVLLEGLCSKWQRSGAESTKKVADQEAFEDISLELCTSFNAVDQLSVVLDLMQFAVRLRGDNSKEEMSNLDCLVFDRSKYSLPKLRHFRFVVVGMAVKVLSNRNLYEMLSKNNDQELYNMMLPIGKKLLTTSVDLDEFINKEMTIAERSEDAVTLRYWVALLSRSEIISEKLRHLLPGGVAAQLITSVLENSSTDFRMKEKAIQMANSKLIQDGFFYLESGINEEHLIRLATVLNQWISPERSSADKILLCQSSAFSLKLIAKRIPLQSESTVLAETMSKCVATAEKWQTLDECMVGNVLLLAGELIRSHNMRSTMLSAEPLLKICLKVLTECISRQKQASAVPEEVMTKRERVRHQSLCGRKFGSETLLICALTCLQRILAQYAAFVTPNFSEILIIYSRLSAKFRDVDSVSGVSIPAVSTPQGAIFSNKTNVQNRLDMINNDIRRVDFRILPTHFGYAVQQLANEEKALCILFNLLGSFFNMSQRKVFSQICMTLFQEIFLVALKYRLNEKKPENFENVGTVEKTILTTLLRLVDILTENDIKPMFNAFVKYAEVAMTSSEREDRLKIIHLFHFAQRFYEAYNSLAMPYFSKIIDLSLTVLRRLNATTAVDTTQLILTGKKDTIEGLETDLAITLVLEFISNCCRHKEFISQELADRLLEPLVDELVNTRVAGHEKRCVPYLAEALFRLSDAVPDSFPAILNKVLLKTRSNRPKIRFRTLLVVESLFDKVGDSLAPHLPIIMPFLSELLEDENKNVEDQCDRVVQLLQRKFGENIADNA